MNLVELNLLASTLFTTSISCKAKEKFINYLIKENQSKNEIIDILAGNRFYKNTHEQKLQHPRVFIVKTQHLNVF